MSWSVYNYHVSKIIYICTFICLFIYTHTYTDTHTHTLIPISCLLNRARRKLEFYRLTQNCVCVCSVASLVSDFLWPHELYPASILSPWVSPGKNTGVRCHTFIQGILTQGSKPHLLHLLQCEQILSSWTKVKQTKIWLQSSSLCKKHRYIKVQIVCI